MLALARQQTPPVRRAGRRRLEGMIGLKCAVADLFAPTVVAHIDWAESTSDLWGAADGARLNGLPTRGRPAKERRAGFCRLFGFRAPPWAVSAPV